MEVGRGHGRLPPRPQPRPGPGLKFRLSRSLSRRLDRIRLLGRELERWPGPGDWPGFKWLARFQAELLRVIMMPVTVCRD